MAHGLWAACLAMVLLLSPMAMAQTLTLHDRMASYVGLTNTVVTLSGRAELRLTGAGDPLPGCVVHLDSPDAWLLLAGVAPSQAAGLAGRVRVDGVVAVRDVNVRLAQYAQGTMVIPHSPGYPSLEVFSDRYFTGLSRQLNSYIDYDSTSLGPIATSFGSFRLKRGYMATLAQQENGSGVSRCYVAQDGDLEVARLPASLENNVRFVRVFPWRWVAKKGIAGNIESGLDVDWLYNWNLDRNSTLDWEYVPIRQVRWWPSLDQDWKARGATHVLGYNEPDRPDQANITVGDAIWSWPDLLGPGLRVGAPAVSDGGLGWLYEFMSQADAAGLRVDFVPVHYYRCYGNVGDAAGTANQFYNFLKGIHDVVKRPLWVTEWNNGASWTGCADPTPGQQQAAVAAILDMLDRTPFVERYALYNWVEDVRRVKWDDGSLTSAGVTYRDQQAPLAYRQEMPDSGIGTSARYSFDGHAHDLTDNGHAAMLVGVPVFTSGKYGQAVSLNGTTDYLQLSPRLADSADWSFAGWVYWNGGGSWQRIFDFGEDTSHYLFLSPRSSGGSLRFEMVNGDSPQQLSAPALVPGVWTHLAVTIAGNTGRLYVNGAPVATNSSMTINPVDVGTRFNFLGKSQFSADPLFSGRFDDFRFFSSALTDAQVSAIAGAAPVQFRATTLFKPDAWMQQPYTATLAGDAVGTGPLTFSKVGGPAWLTVAPNGGLSGTPGGTNGGLNNFLVRVTDTNNSMHTATLLIPVPEFTAVIASGADDAEQSASGVVNLTSTDLELVNDAAGGVGDQLIGLRFAHLPIPRGALVTNAIIQFTADEAQSEATTLDIHGEAADHAAPFAATANNLGARAHTPWSVPWTPAPWVVGQSNAAQRTPNLAGLVQEIVLRPGWASGNAVAFLISGSGHRTADSFDEAGGFPARLTVHFAMPTPQHTLIAMVTGSENDAEQSSAGVVNLTSTDLELVNDSGTGSGDQILGLRFENLSLPGTAVVASADIQFTADEAQSEPTALVLRAQAADNAAAFTTTVGNLGARPVTVAAVSWAPPPWNNVGERSSLQGTPDLAPVLREILTRPGWQVGNAVVFLVTGTGHRTAESVDKSAGLPAELRVVWWPEQPLGSYARWAMAFPGVGAPTDDSDEDGYDNRFEYALGLNATTPSAQALHLTLDGGQVHLTFSRPTSALGVTGEVQWRDNLQAGTWSGTGVVTRIIADDGVFRTFRSTLPAGAAGQRFVRLRIVER